MPPADEDELEVDDVVDVDDAESLDEDDLEVDDFSDPFDDADDDVAVFAPADDDDDEDDADDAPAAAVARPAGDDDDDDDEPDPDDVEEDLNTILRDRLTSSEDIDDEGEVDDDDEEIVAPPIQATEDNKVAPKREDEWTCHGCFLIVSARQFGKRESPTCPSGDGDCPSLAKL